MVVSLWSRLWSVITTSNDLNPALPEAPTSAQATCAAQAAPPQILQVGFCPQRCCSALQGVILIYSQIANWASSNCKVYFLPILQVGILAAGLHCKALLLFLQSGHYTSGGLWCCAAILQVGLLQAAPLTVKRRSPFKGLWLTTQPLSLVLMRYQL